MGFQTNIDTGPVEATPVNLESLLASLCSVRQRLWEQSGRQGRALIALGFFHPAPSAANSIPAPAPAFNDALSVLAREVEHLSRTCDGLTGYAQALENQYSEKSSL